MRCERLALLAMAFLIVLAAPVLAGGGAATPSGREYALSKEERALLEQLDGEQFLGKAKPAPRPAAKKPSRTPAKPAPQAVFRPKAGPVLGPLSKEEQALLDEFRRKIPERDKPAGQARPKPSRAPARPATRGYDFSEEEIAEVLRRSAQQRREESRPATKQPSRAPAKPAAPAHGLSAVPVADAGVAGVVAVGLVWFVLWRRRARPRGEGLQSAAREVVPDAAPPGVSQGTGTSTLPGQFELPAFVFDEGAPPLSEPAGPDADAVLDPDEGTGAPANRPSDAPRRGSSRARRLAVFAVLTAGAVAALALPRRRESVRPRDTSSPADREVLGPPPEDRLLPSSGSTTQKEDRSDKDAGLTGPHLLSDEELLRLPLEELRLYRNAIYARHGCCFGDPKLQAYFDKQPWYRPMGGRSAAGFVNLTHGEAGLVAHLEALEDWRTALAQQQATASAPPEEQRVPAPAPAPSVATTPQPGYTPPEVRPAAGGVYSDPGGGHWITENSDDGSVLTLEDGSLWLVDPVDRADTAVWVASTDIVVRDTSPDGEYDYTLVNTDDSETAHAKYLGQN